MTEEQAANKPSAESVFQPRRRSSQLRPPLTPLIDVFLFLIVFFLLACQFHQAEGAVPACLPRVVGVDPAAPPPAEPLVVLLSPGDPDGPSVRIEAGIGTMTAVADMRALHEYLRGRAGTYGPDLRVVIKPAKGVRWGPVADAVNQAARAGLPKVGVAFTDARQTGH